MTRRDEVIRMARESGMEQLVNGQMCSDWRPEIERFAALVSAAERDRCADAVAAEHLEGGPTEDAGDISYDCAIDHAMDAIRALKDEVIE